MMVATTPARDYTPGQALIYCSAGQRHMATFVSFHRDPERDVVRAMVDLPDGRRASVALPALHPLDKVVAASTGSMDGWHGVIYDTDSATPVHLRVLWKCAHAHRKDRPAQSCAADELRRWRSA